MDGKRWELQLKVGGARAVSGWRPLKCQAGVRQDTVCALWRWQGRAAVVHQVRQPRQRLQRILIARREFLASEAMHNLGVSTARALSLIVSGKRASGTRPTARFTPAPTRDGHHCTALVQQGTAARDPQHGRPAPGPPAAGPAGHVPGTGLLRRCPALFRPLNAIAPSASTPWRCVTLT